MCLGDQYYIHNIRDMQVLHIMKEVSANPKGLFALSVTNETGFIAYPGSENTGCIEIFDSIRMVHVHFYLDTFQKKLCCI